jgi:5-methyltetrahydrofolate--homocysteine methyltransferase
LRTETKLVALLDPDETIGVHLTKGFLLEPEQSSSAIAVHHPDPRKNTSYRKGPGLSSQYQV